MYSFWCSDGEGVFVYVAMDLAAPMVFKQVSANDWSMCPSLGSSWSLGISLRTSLTALSILSSILTQRPVSEEGEKLLVFPVSSWNKDDIVSQKGSGEIITFCLSPMGFWSLVSIVFGASYTIILDCAICYDITGDIMGGLRVKFRVSGVQIIAVDVVRLHNEEQHMDACPHRQSRCLDLSQVSTSCPSNKLLLNLLWYNIDIIYCFS